MDNFDLNFTSGLGKNQIKGKSIGFLIISLAKIRDDRQEKWGISIHLNVINF